MSGRWVRRAAQRTEDAAYLAAYGVPRPPSREDRREAQRAAIGGLRHSTETAMQADKDLDVRGLNCPLPILKAKKALA